MDFKDLLQKMQQLDEGLEPSIEECGGMPTIVQGEPPHEESLNMNLTINSKGADGIRDLINVLKGIDGDEPKDEPKDADALFGNDEDEEDHEIVIGDDFKNSKHGDKGPHKFDIDAVLPVGDDLFSKGDEAPKQAGGGNPWHMRNESLVNDLASLYEEVKGRQKKR